MVLPLVPLAIAILSAIAYALPLPPKASELARLLFAVAALATLLALSSPHATLIAR